MNSELVVEPSLSRQAQMFAVLGVAYLLQIIGSVRVVLGTRHLHPVNPRVFVFGVCYQLFGLLCLYLALRHQKRPLSDIGFSLPLRIRELGHSFALFVGAMFSSILFYFVASFSLRLFFGHSFQKTYDHAALFGTSVTLFTWLFVLINPFHEELIVRAFLITEVESTYRSTAFAIAASVAVQISYHLYQGWPAALSHIPAFLLFSIYYVRRRRILPVILAHMYMDLIALSIYARHLH